MELETEKRSTQKALAKESRLKLEDARLEKQIESLQVDLAEERRQRHMVECEAQKASTEAENRKITLESRLDAFRSKLETTKEQLKRAQEVQNVPQTANSARVSRGSTSIDPTTLVKNPRKRVAVQMDADTMIGTPGDLPTAKKTRTSALPGEKSTFSITPFLNRTMSVAPESPPSDEGIRDGRDGVEIRNRLSAANNQKAPTSEPISASVNETGPTRPIARAKRPGAPPKARIGKVASRALPARQTKAPPSLEQVVEEDHDETGSSPGSLTEPTASKNVIDDTISEGIETKRRKRKLLGGGLGKTLFDEDELDVANGGQSLLGTRAFGPLARGGLGGQKAGPRKTIGSSLNTLSATISPLKRNHKAA